MISVLRDPNRKAQLAVPTIYTTNVGAASVQALPQNPNRQMLEISNKHATNTLYYYFGGTATTTNSVALPPNTTIIFDAKVPWESVNLIASGAGTSVLVREYN